MSRKKLGSAIVEFCQPQAAALAAENERGLVGNQLTITWLSGKPADAATAAAPSDYDKAADDDVLLTGFTFNSSSTPIVVDDDGTAADDDSREDVTGKTAAAPASENGTSATSNGGAAWNFASNPSDDFETLVLRNLRQAQERKKLEEQLLAEESAQQQ